MSIELELARTLASIPNERPSPQYAAPMVSLSNHRNHPQHATFKSVLLLCCTLVGAFVGSTKASTLSSPPQALQPLLATINERLNVGDLVALTKWDSGKPILDSAREAQVTASARARAIERKMDPEELGQFLAAQMEANKLVQYGLLARWQAAGKAPDIPRPNLANQIRPRLDELQERLMQQYASFAPYRSDPRCPDWIAQARASLAMDHLHELALIRATGELCTTDPRPRP